MHLLLSFFPLQGLHNPTFDRGISNLWFSFKHQLRACWCSIEQPAASVATSAETTPTWASGVWLCDLPEPEVFFMHSGWRCHWPHKAGDQTYPSQHHVHKDIGALRSVCIPGMGWRFGSAVKKNWRTAKVTCISWGDSFWGFPRELVKLLRVPEETKASLFFFESGVGISKTERERYTHLYIYTHTLFFEYYPK